MAATQVFHGVNTHWGLGTTTVTVTNATGIYQSADYEAGMDESEARDQRGNAIGTAQYNYVESLTIEYLASDAQTASGSALIAKPDPGTLLTVVADNVISGSGWITKGTSTRQTNTAATVVSVKANRYPLITS
jgi:hypothetical protein